MITQRSSLLSATALLLSSIALVQPGHSQCSRKSLDASLPECSPNAIAGYPGRECIVTIDRTQPFSPAAFSVPKNTDIYIKLTNPRLNETVQFIPTFSGIPSQDVFGNAVQSATGGPLQSLIVSLHLSSAAASAARDTDRRLASHAAAVPHSITDDILARQKAIAKKLSTLAESIAQSNIKLSCLQAYEDSTAYDPTTPNALACSTSHFPTPAAFLAAKNTIGGEVATNAKANVDVGELGKIDAILKDALDNCKSYDEQAPAPAHPVVQPNECDDVSTLLLYQHKLDDTATDILTGQKQLQAAQLVLENTPTTLPDFFTCVSLTQNSTGTVNVTTQIPPQVTTTTIASVPVTFGISHWLASTGAGFSFSGANSYSNAPLLVNGKPVLDSGGKAETIVTRSTTKPTVLAPLVMVSYMIPGINQWHWESACPRHCGFLLSGGVGANLTSSPKSADFVVGISFQLGSVLVTPSADVTRDVRLSQGVFEGAQLGSSPPSPLPTRTVWTTKLSIGLSYILPIGSSGSSGGK